MRSIFKGHFRPSEQELSDLWKSALFAVDANVLLNLYRYSNDTRQALEVALKSASPNIFISHQAAKEFLKNRVIVTAEQSEEYTKAIKTIESMSQTLSHKKRHPFITDDFIPEFDTTTSKLISELKAQKEKLLERLVQDEILNFVEDLFDGKTGSALPVTTMETLLDEGRERYDNKIPPGYKDVKKDEQGDPYRPYGDLIVWKQLIEKSKNENKPIIFVSDDKKEDWWLIQSGRTISPRPELREEFIHETGMDFWMYSVDKFLEESAKSRQQEVSSEAIKEVLQLRSENQGRHHHRGDNQPFNIISTDELLERIKLSQKWAAQREGFLGLHNYVHGYLGTAGFDYSSSYDAIDHLASDGLLEIYNHQGEGHERPVRAIRVVSNEPSPTSPFSNLKNMMENSEKS